MIEYARNTLMENITFKNSTCNESGQALFIIPDGAYGASTNLYNIIQIGNDEVNSISTEGSFI
eukprot:jgi/Orpsp1_1/1188144/evm.model.d7180000062794.1